jgi:tetratricopeptide (TPR) repeat protein
VARRELAAATDAFLRAVELNGALPGSWTMLEKLWRLAGRAAEAAVAAGEVRRLAALPAGVVAATGLLADGEWLAAEQVVRGFLATHPADPEALRLLARIALEQGAVEDAGRLLELALGHAPGHAGARYDLVRTLIRRHQHVRARAEAETLLAQDPGNRDYRAAYATACVGVGEEARALGVYEALLAEVPEAAEVRLSAGHVLKTLGRETEAAAAYRAAAALRPAYGDAWWSLANLKTVRFSAAEIERLRGALADPATRAADRCPLAFALGRALEDEGAYAESFAHYREGNALRRAATGYRPEAIEAEAARQRALFTPAFLAARAGVGCPDAAPIFVVGLPRSGSTLIEQILASHPAVEGTGELADIPRLVHLLGGDRPPGATPAYPDGLATLPAADFERLGAGYLAGTLPFRSGRPHFVDKMPNNFRHLGLIHLMLPNARIIDARREPMACCFSVWKQLFASGQEWSYGFEDIARYYRSYLGLMAHWEAVLPGRILRVAHEDVVADLEGSVRRLLDFLGLPFDPACVEFHRTARSVRTASASQVRRPLFRDGLDEWRRFEPWLAPLREQLADLADLA